MKEIIEEHVPMKIKYEYLTDKNEQKFSKEFEVNLTLDPDNFEENEVIILNTCNFRSKEERVYYHMFDLEKEIFITKADQLKDFKKNKKTIVMKSCTIFSKQIIEQLREKELRYKQGKNIDIDETNNSTGAEIARLDILCSMDDIKLTKIFFNLKRNYLDVDMFAEEFISYEGIKFLISFLQLTSGNLRTYAIEAINKLLDFQSSTDYIKKRNEIIDTLYEILMTSNNMSCVLLLTLNTLISIISIDEEKAMYLIDVAENYAKKSVTQIFSQIIGLLLNNKATNINIKTLLFINVLLNYCDSAKLPKLLIQFREAGIYEALEKIAKNKDKEFQEQLTNFQIKTGKIICGSEHELHVYKKQVKDMKEKCKSIEEKFEKNIETQLMYERIVEELSLFQNDLNVRDKSKVLFDHIAAKKRHGNVEVIPDIKYDENGIFDFVNILKNDESDSNQERIILFNKYFKTKVESQKIEEDIKELESKQKELIDEKVNNLQTQIKNISYKKEVLNKENQDLESKIKELEEAISKGNFKKDISPSSTTSGTPSTNQDSATTPQISGPIPPPLPPPPPPPPPGIPFPPGLPPPPPPCGRSSHPWS